jgi:hypothetical protein
VDFETKHLHLELPSWHKQTRHSDSVSEWENISLLSSMMVCVCDMMGTAYSGHIRHVVSGRSFSTSFEGFRSGYGDYMTHRLHCCTCMKLTTFVMRVMRNSCQCICCHCLRIGKKLIADPVHFITDCGK